MNNMTSCSQFIHFDPEEDRESKPSVLCQLQKSQQPLARYQSPPSFYSSLQMNNYIHGLV